MGDFYGTGIEIWPGFGLVGFFKFSWAKKTKKHCSVRTKKLHKMKLEKIFLLKKFIG